MTTITTYAHSRVSRFVLMLLVMLIYVGVDLVMVSSHPTVPAWDVHVDTYGVVTWVEPNGPADAAGLRAGDQILVPAGFRHIPYADVARTAILHIHSHSGAVRVIRAHGLFGPTHAGQALVLVGALLLLVGGLVWTYGRGGRAPWLLALLAATAAGTLLGYVWENDGFTWAIHLSSVFGVIFFPCTWAFFFLSFPCDRYGIRRWRAPFILLTVLALITLCAYALTMVAFVPYAIVHALGGLVFLYGLLLGLVALVFNHNQDSMQARQQWRIVTSSAAGAMLPVLLLSFIPDVLNHPLLPFEVTALAMVMLPLGLAYAIVRYDLMGLDVVVRRVVAAALGGFMLVTVTAAATLALRPVLGGLTLLPLVVAVLAGAASSDYVRGLSRTLAERLLSPELIRSRHLLVELQRVLQRGEEDLTSIVMHIEEAASAATGVPWTQLLVRRRAPGALFRASREGASHLALPGLAVALAEQPWGIAEHDAAGDEWRTLTEGLEATPALLMPLRMRGEVIAVLAVAERTTADALSGPDREVLALLLSHAALAVDHARVRAELEEEGADAAALSAASMRLTSALDDRAALPRHIVAALGALRDVRGVTLLWNEPHGERVIAAAYGEPIPMAAPADPAAAVFTPGPTPGAWLPLMVGETATGALCIRWSETRVIHDHDRRLLTVYANGAAMALEHARLYERARIQAERDPVTDLYNHRAFHARLEIALERAETTGGHVGLLLIDVADFKLFNDTHGHQAGDQALRRVSEVLQACCRTADAAARLGGDEFAVLLPDALPDTAYTIAERISDLAGLSELTLPEGQRLPVRLSIGAATFPSDAEAPNALLACADERMYAAKRAGVAIAATNRVGGESEAMKGDGRFGIIEALVAMVDNRDRYTGEHSEQVARYACAIAAELGLSHDTIGTLRMAGLLHDVGKIGVPDRILRKPDKLTPEERDIVSRHVELSEVLLTVVSQDRDLMDAVRYHHERWDGHGYPRGVAGEDVPLLGRIMIVADAVSAMGMDRPYRKGLSWATIAQELGRGAGAQFDPTLVPVALRALRTHIARADAA